MVFILWEFDYCDRLNIHDHSEHLLMQLVLTDHLLRSGCLVLESQRQKQMALSVCLQEICWLSECRCLPETLNEL